MPRFGTLSVAAVISSLIGGSEAGTPDNVSSRLQIQVPQSHFKDDGYKHREALFGFPPYGGSIAQNVYYSDSDLCDPTVDTRKGYPIRAKDESGKMAPWPSPYILMVDRGGCSFVQKVRNAQRSGAAGVIIADNMCLCSDADCVSANGEGVCQTAEPIMADDGSGSDISIPSFLMFKKDADTVKAELRANHMVQIEMTWALPSPDGRVEYDLWTVPSDLVSRDFQKNFKEVAVALGERAYFTPHQYIYDGVKSYCQGADGDNRCFNLCTNNGRYCATDPDNNLDHGISGADVVKESLRRICIWKHYGESNGIGSEWWDYISEFLNQCDTPDYFSNDDCIKDAYKHSNIDAGTIDRCMNDSGGLTSDAPNAFLDLEMAAQKRRGVVVIPTVFVNTVALRGALTVGNVFSALCAGFAGASVPEICSKCSSCPDVGSCAKSGKCQEKQEHVSASGSNDARIDAFTNSMIDTFADSIEDELGQCGIDVGAIISSVGELGRGMDGGIRLLRSSHYHRALDGIEALVLDEKDCSKEEEAQFVNALDEFSTCTGWNLMELIESFPSALVGTAIKCARVALSAGYDVMEAIDIDTQTVMENIGECADHIFGDNPLGKMIHEFYRYPDRNCPCFSALHDSTPECVMDIWPIPMFGGMIKTNSCIVGLGCNYVDDVCLEMINGLDECLPKFDADEDVPCDDIRDQCPLLSVTLLPQFDGLPLPDACERVYHADQGLSNTKVLERMDIFRKRCSAGEGLWNDQDFAPSYGNEGNIVSDTKSQQILGNKAPEPSHRGSGATLFLGGTFLGFILGAFSLVLFVRWRGNNASGVYELSSQAIGKMKSYAVVDSNAQLS